MSCSKEQDYGFTFPFEVKQHDENDENSAIDLFNACLSVSSENPSKGGSRTIKRRQTQQKGGAPQECNDFINTMDSVQNILHCVNTENNSAYYTLHDIHDDYLDRSEMKGHLQKYLTENINYFEEIKAKPSNFPGVVIKCLKNVIIGNYFQRQVVNRFKNNEYNIYSNSLKDGMGSLKSDGTKFIAEDNMCSLPTTFESKDFLMFKICFRRFNNRKDILQFCLLVSLMKYAHTLIPETDTYILCFNNTQSWPLGYKFSFYQEKNDENLRNKFKKYVVVKKEKSLDDLKKRLAVLPLKVFNEILKKVNILKDSNEMIRIRDIVLFVHPDKGVRFITLLKNNQEVDDGNDDYIKKLLNSITSKLNIIDSDMISLKDASIAIAEGILDVSELPSGGARKLIKKPTKPKISPKIKRK